MLLLRCFVLIFAAIASVGTTIILYQHWIDLHRHYFHHAAAYVPLTGVNIQRWQPNHLRSIDSRRIFMHKTRHGDLSARQSCAIESAARHNPDRSVQLFMPAHLNQEQSMKTSSSPWLFVLQHYPNVEVILYDDAEYFNDTVLTNWYSNGKWRRSPYSNSHLSNFVRAISLFRGGGVFLDMDTVITIKALAGSKWENFLVKQMSQATTSGLPTITSDILHFVHGHHLIDMLLLKLAESVHNNEVEPHDIFANALDDSMQRICGGVTNDINQCRDVQLLSSENIYISFFESLVMQFILEMNRNKGDAPLLTLVEEAMKFHDAILMKWDSITADLTMQQQKGSIIGKSFSYETVLSHLLADHCPQTIANENEFLSSIQ